MSQASAPMPEFGSGHTGGLFEHGTADRSGHRSRASADDIVIYSDRQVVDEQGQTVGKVQDVLFEGASDSPTWLVVKPGFLRSAHYVPVRGSYTTVTEKVVVPFNRETIRRAPKANSDHVLTSEARAELAQHYALAT